MTLKQTEQTLQEILRGDLLVAQYPDELSEMNDGDKLFISLEDLIEHREKILKILAQEINDK